MYLWGLSTYWWDHKCIRSHCTGRFSKHKANQYLCRFHATTPNLLVPFSSKFISSPISQDLGPIFCPAVNYKVLQYSGHWVYSRKNACCHDTNANSRRNEHPSVLALRTANRSSTVVRSLSQFSKLTELSHRAAAVFFSTIRAPHDLNGTILVTGAWIFMFILTPSPPYFSPLF